ncbi:unnamed protein product [Allacma fusca]|uniref:Uncharacterized protein n=1 Tax=Allacma fusca TaxID=39272 RepID=A0A8J2JGN6_9HEXA|nr:unnamed protein product [Allacma fusca]
MAKKFSLGQRRFNQRGNFEKTPNSNNFETLRGSLTIEAFFQYLVRAGTSCQFCDFEVLSKNWNNFGVATHISVDMYISSFKSYKIVFRQEEII